MRCEESNLKCGLWEAGPCITIMCLFTQHCQLDSSSKNIKFLPFHILSIDLTSPLQTFFYSLNSILPLRRLQTVENIITNATDGFKAIPQTSFEHCFQNGNVSGRVAVMCKGTVLKEIIFSRLKAEKDN